jgi:flagellar biosynthetic protein FliR
MDLDTISLTRLGSAILCGMARISGLMLFAPFFSSEVMSPALKGGLCLALTALLLPAYQAQVRAMEHWNDWLTGIAGEFLIGLVLGLALQMLFEAANAAGQIGGVQIGFSLVNVLDPQTQVDTSVLSALYSLLVTLIFLRLNVHHWLLRGLAASFSYIPPGTGSLTHPLALNALRMANGIWLAAVQIAGPVLVATLLCDVGFGFLGKASPQLTFVSFGLPAKYLAGMLTMAGAIGMWPDYFERYFRDAIVWGEQLLHLVG